MLNWIKNFPKQLKSLFKISNQQMQQEEVKIEETFQLQPKLEMKQDQKLPNGNQLFIGAQICTSTINQLKHKQHQFTLNARVIQKFQTKNYVQKHNPHYHQSPIKENNSLNGNIENNNYDGKLFSIKIIDQNNSEITCSFFNEAHDLFHDKIEQGKIYRFSNGYVSQNKMNTQELNILFDTKSTISEIEEDDGKIPLNKFNLVKIQELVQTKPGARVDVLGIVLDEIKEDVTLLKKNNEQKLRKTFYISDETNSKIQVVLWGEVAKLQIEPEQIIILKQGLLGLFNNTPYITISFDQQVYINPVQHEEAQNLAIFRDTQQIIDKIQPLKMENQEPQNFKEIPMEIKDFNQILKELQDSSINQRKYFKIKAIIKSVKTQGQIYYNACVDERCSKKAEFDNDNSIYFCEKCKKVFEIPKVRYVQIVKLVDSSDRNTGQELWVSIYDQIATQIFGFQASEIKELIESQENGQFRAGQVMKHAVQGKEYELKIMSKLEKFNENVRLNHQILKIEKIEQIPSIVQSDAVGIGKNFSQESNILTVSQIDEIIREQEQKDQKEKDNLENSQESKVPSEPLHMDFEESDSMLFQQTQNE